MDVVKDEGGAAFELEDISRRHHGSNHASSSENGHVRCSSSTLGDDFEDSEEHIRKESFLLFTSDEERAVIRKLDRHLVLFVAFLYMLSFLDRSSISPAFTKDSKLTLKKFRYR